jgi:hypothetical protein
MEPEWLDKLTEGWIGSVSAAVAGGLLLTALLMAARGIWRRCRLALFFLVRLAIQSVALGGFVLWAVPRVDRSDDGVFWPDLPPERLAVLAGASWFALGVALRTLDCAVCFAFFHVSRWLDQRAGVERNGLTFADWWQLLDDRSRQAAQEARQRFWQPLLDRRQKRMGFYAGCGGLPVTANPFPSDSPAGMAWARGYQEWAVFYMDTREHWLPTNPTDPPHPFVEGLDPLWGQDKMPGPDGWDWPRHYSPADEGAAPHSLTVVEIDASR